MSAVITGCVSQPDGTIIVTVQGANEGLAVRIPETMRLSVVARHLAEVLDWLS